MNVYNFGLDYLEKNAPQYKITDPTIGVVTATDHNTFIGVKTLYLSIKNKVNFICYDIGMTEQDLKWCKDHGLKTVKFESKISHIDKWQTFLKPFIIKESPYEYTLWIDSDCIVVGDLSSSDLILSKTTFFTMHWMNQKRIRANDKKLYEQFPVEGDSLLINAGVIGLNKNKHSDILEHWLAMTAIAIQDETGTIRSYLAMHDEGTLTWAIRKTNNGNLIIDEEGKYNLFCEFIEDSLSPLGVDRDYYYYQPIEQFTNYTIPSKFFKRVLECKGFVCHFSTCMENGKKYWLRWS